MRHDMIKKYPTTYLPTYLPTYLRTHLPTYLPTYLPSLWNTPRSNSRDLWQYLPIYLHMYLPTYLPAYLSTSLIEHPWGEILETYDLWDTDYKSDNWEPEFMTIFATWQLRVTLDSIRNSCDVLFGTFHIPFWQCFFFMENIKCVQNATT